jgi:hypothetical protein
MSFDYPSYFVKPNIQTNIQTNRQTNSLLVPVNMSIEIPMNSIYTLHNYFNPNNIYLHNIECSIMQKPEYDYVVFIILTKDSNNNIYGLLPITNSNYVNLSTNKVNIGDNPEYVMNKLIKTYGIEPHNFSIYEKFTQLKHVEEHNNKSYKINVLYSPNISHTKLNSNYQIINNNNRIEYVDLNRNYKYCSDFTTNNILHALKTMIYKLI